MFRTISRVFLAILLGSIVAGGFVGINRFMKSVPATGYLTKNVTADPAKYASLERFIDTVRNGNRKQLVGVYVPDVLALPVNQQPTGDASYVTHKQEQATQFAMASQHGTIGILAHNDLAGAEFLNLHRGQAAIAIYGDGRLEYFIVDQVQRFQALAPNSPFSDFVNLDKPSELLSAGELFSRVYTKGSQLVFQTCINAHGNPSWGRMFIIARPAPQPTLYPARRLPFFERFSSLGIAAAS